MADVSMVTDLPPILVNNGTAAAAVGPNWIFLTLLPMVLVTALGNILVCIVVIHVPKLQTVNNIFLMSLAVADLMVAVLVMPLGLVKDFYGVWPTDPSLCSIWSTLDVFCCTASILHISIISLDRYLAVSDPLRFSQSRRRTSGMVCKILLVWLTSAALSSPLLVLGLAQRPGIIDYGGCSIQSFHFKLYGSAVAFFIPLMLVVVTYLLTTLTLRKKSRLFVQIARQSDLRPQVERGSRDGESLVSQSKERQGDSATTDKSVRETHPLSQSSTMRRSATLLRGKAFVSNERKANKVLFLVFVVFVLAWTPFFVVNIFFAFCTNCPGADDLFVVLTWIGWASSMVNPIIYTTFNADFRLAFWRILSCHCSRGCGIKSQGTASQILSSSLQRGQTASLSFKQGHELGCKTTAAHQRLQCADYITS